MGPKWYITLFLIVIGGGMLCGIAEGSFLGIYGTQGFWNVFFEVFKSKNIFTAAVELISLTIHGGAYNSLWQMFTWNYAVLDVQPGETIRVFLWVAMAALAFSIIWDGLHLVRGG